MTLLLRRPCFGLISLAEMRQPFVVYCSRSETRRRSRTTRISTKISRKRGAWRVDCGSLALFAGGVAIYLSSITSLSTMIATQISSMSLFALLVLPVFIILSLLGSTTPLESMPERLQRIMRQTVPARGALRYQGARGVSACSEHTARAKSNADSIRRVGRARQQLAIVRPVDRVHDFSIARTINFE